MIKTLLLLIISIELIVLGTVSKYLYENKKIFGTISVNPIKKENLLLGKKGSLDYFFEPKPNSIIQPEPIFAGLEHVSYTINDDGLNQLKNYTLSKNNDTYRILTIGDSMTFGVHVNTEENYPSQLNQLLNSTLSCLNIKKFEVINLGVGAYDIQYTVTRLKTRGIKYNPDIVIWLLIPDDLTRLNELLIPKVNQLKKNAQKTGEYQKRIQNNIYYTEWIQAKNEIIKDIGENNILLLQKTYFNQINEFYSGSLVLAVFPLEENYQNFVEILASQRKKTFFYDKLPNIYEIEKAVLPDHIHPTKYGNQIIAENLMNYMVDKKIIPCRRKN